MMIHHRPTKRVRSVLLFNRLFTPEFYLFSCIFDIFFKSILLFLHFAFFYYYYPLCFPILPLLFICVNLLSNFPIFFIFFLFHPWLIFLFMSYLLTLFLLGGGVKMTPSPVVFLHNSKSIGLRLLKFSDFSYIPIALPLGLKQGFNTNCLSPQAHCLNDCVCL